MSELQPEELGDQVFDETEPPLILDIRHEDEYADWHIPTSKNIDIYDELKDDPAAAKDALTNLPGDQPIVTVCAVGKRSQRATDLLQETDRDAATLVDGMAGWSRLHREAPLDIDIDGTLIQVARPGKGCLSYILISNGDAAVFDPSQYLDEYEARIDKFDATLVGVFDTHAHADHISGGPQLAERHDVPYYLHPADAQDRDITPVTDGQTITIGTVPITVHHTPGHSPGGVTYDVDTGALLTGDTLFHESVGRVELGITAGITDNDTEIEDNAATLYESLQHLLAQDESAVVLPAHDPGVPVPPVVTRLGDVIDLNPDLGRDRDAFITDLAGDLPEHPPNFQRVKRINIGEESLPADERASLEVGPNNCAVE